MDKLTALAAKRLKNAINSKGLTQTEVAERAGLTLATINAFCNGHKRVINETFQQIIDAIGLPLSYFISPERGEHPAFPGQEMSPVEQQILKVVDDAITRLTASKSAPVLQAAEAGTADEKAARAETIALLNGLTLEGLHLALGAVQAIWDEHRKSTARRRDQNGA